MSRVFTVAAAQYPIDRLGSWQAYKAKLVRWVESAAREGAQLLVFPEYGGMELASLFGPEVERDLGRQLEAVAGLEAEVAGLHRDLARRHGVYLLAGSQPPARATAATTTAPASPRRTAGRATRTRS
jgi:predicted amidohydrolase